MSLRWLLVPFTFCLVGQAQRPASEFNFEPGADSLASRYDHALWPDPESLARDLRSDDDETRFKALRLVGIPEDRARTGGKWVSKPDEVELRYAAIGDDNTLDAVLALTVNSDATFAAVAVPKGKEWERIGAFQCWCKVARNPLQNFVAIEASPLTNEGWEELVLRATGDGTGFYLRNEVHFRVHDGSLRKIISFVSYTQTCPGDGGKCTSTEERFQDNALVKTRERFEPAAGPPESATCTRYEWDPVTFRYKAVGPPKKCAKPTPP